jgi:hypothetical protein
MAAASRTTVSIADPNVNVTGNDCIWHNMYADSDFRTLRKWFECDADEMLLKIAGHVRDGLYSLISLNASKHSFVVVCACSKNLEGLPEGWFEG